MNEILQLIATNFANATAIVNLVGDKCSFVTEIQESNPPFVTYAVQENNEETKDGSVNYLLAIFIASKSLTELITIYDTVRSTVFSNLSMLYPKSQGSTFPERLEDWDDNYTIELQFLINN